LRTKEYGGIFRIGGRPSWTFTPDGKDEAWIYELGGGVYIVIGFNSDGITNGNYETTGVKYLDLGEAVHD
jgi:hypothetical protein